MVFGEQIFRMSKLEYNFNDERGYFIESYKKCLIDKKLSKSINFVQDNLVFSKKNSEMLSQCRKVIHEHSSCEHVVHTISQ